MTTGGVAEDEGGFLPLLAVGATADIFIVDDDRVLRRYRDMHDASAEAALLQHVVDHGFPAPAVYSCEGSDLVLERLHGPTLLQALAAGEFSLQDSVEIMADLHHRLHAIPPPAGTSGDDVVVHLDLHPGNIVLSETHGPALVDWGNAAVGSVDLDIAMSAIILAEVAADSGGDYSRAARAMLAAFLAVAGGNPLAQLDAASRSRLEDPALLPSERSLVAPAAALVRRYAPDVIIGASTES
jgi:aminoglycoside phosphotransferase (APT) family kinase protein